MSTEQLGERKRKSTEVPKAVISNKDERFIRSLIHKTGCVTIIAEQKEATEYSID
jgi:hypothetical protein